MENMQTEEKRKTETLHWLSSGRMLLGDSAADWRLELIKKGFVLLSFCRVRLGVCLPRAVFGDVFFRPQGRL